MDNTQNLAFFDLLPNPDFLRPLTGKNKYRYLQSLFILKELIDYSNINEVDRQTYHQDLTYQFRMTPDCFTQDISHTVDMDIESNSSPEEKATKMIRNLKRYGWLYEENNANNISIFVSSSAKKFLDFFFTVSKDAKKEMEYQSIISVIYSLTKNELALKTNPYSQVLLPMIKATNELREGLKTLNSNVNKIVEEQSKKSSEEILKFYLSKESSNITASFYRLKTNGNISVFNTEILGLLSKFLVFDNSELFNKAVSECMQIEKIDREEAKNNIDNKARYLDNFFTFGYNELLKDIDDNYTKYITYSFKKIKFMAENENNDSKKVSGILSNLKEIENILGDKNKKKSEIETFFEERNFLIKAKEPNIFTPSSFYKEKTSHIVKKSIPISKVVDENKAKENAEKNLSSYIGLFIQKDNLAKTVKKLLGNDKRNRISNLINVENQKDLAFIRYIFSEGRSIYNKDYRVKLIKNENVKKHGKGYYADYIVERKNKK